MRPRGLALAALFATAIGACSAEAPGRDRAEGANPDTSFAAACSAAVAAFDHEISVAGDRPLVLSQGGLGPAESELESGRLEAALLGTPSSDGDDRQGWFKLGPEASIEKVAPPSVATVKAFLAAKSVNAATCPEMTARAAAAGIVVAHPDMTTMQRSDGLYSHRILSLSVPTISPAGDEALLSMSSVSGPLAGGGFIVLVRRDAAGAWRFAGLFPIWIS